MRESPKSNCLLSICVPITAFFSCNEKNQYNTGEYKVKFLYIHFLTKQTNLVSPRSAGSVLTPALSVNTTRIGKTTDNT